METLLNRAQAHPRITCAGAAALGLLIAGTVTGALVGGGVGIVLLGIARVAHPQGGASTFNGEDVFDVFLREGDNLKQDPSWAVFGNENAGAAARRVAPSARRTVSREEVVRPRTSSPTLKAFSTRHR